MKLNIKIAFSGVIMISGLFLSSCTGEFEKWNINPNEVTSEQMTYDNLNTGAYFTQMEKAVFIVGKDKGGEYQITEMLGGDVFASYVANINTYSYTTYHNDHYALYYGWYNAPFKDAYTDIMQPYRTICKVTGESSVARAMATVVKVLGMSRITDMYGPIPYTKFGSSTRVSYDNQKDIYYKFFEELDSAISIMTDYAKSSANAYMADYDYIYFGNVNKWIKFANTLRLRLAMRISYVDEAKAKLEATAAINQTYGLMKVSEDNAILHQTKSFTFSNPLWEVCENFKDMRMSATMDCYLNGYNDPRVSAYFRTTATDSKYHGVRNGMTNIDKNNYIANASGINYESGSSLKWMDAAEAYFLLAEAKLRLGIGSESVLSYYEKGVATSFASNGISSGSSDYLSNNTNLPLTTYIDPSNNRSTKVESMLSNLTVAWDEKASDATKLERIMVQKWIALFPDGQEAWSEMRRTGYPGWVRISTYSHQSEVANNEMISRLKFPTTEYSNNSENTQSAVTLLGGNDTAGTRLWWDVNRK